VAGVESNIDIETYLHRARRITSCSGTKKVKLSQKEY
jgi:hypothetical protein